MYWDAIEKKFDLNDDWPVISVLLAIAATVLFAMPHAAGMLSFERSVAHELWRAVTCHWVHWNFEHLLWSVATFAVLGALCERLDRKKFAICLIVAATVIPATLWFLQPDLPIYGGLSGIDSALFILLAVTLMIEKVQAKEWVWTAAFATAILAFTAKTAFEFTTNAPLFVSDTTGLTPVPLAHLVGAAVGATTALCAGTNSR